MMRNLILILFISFTSTLLTGQEIETGIVSRLENREQVLKIIGTQNDSVYILKKKKSTFSDNSYSIQVYNENLNPVRIQSIQIPKTNSEVGIKDVFIFDGKIFTFYQEHNKARKTKTVFLLNSNTNSKIKLGEIGYDKYGNQPEFELEVDSNHILLVSKPPIDKASNQTFWVKALDRNLNTIIDEKIELPYPSKSFTLEKIKIQGSSVYFLGNSSSEKDFQNPQSFYVIRYDHSKKSLKEFELNLKGKWITSATFELGKDSSLFVGGFYSNDRSFSVAGTFFLKIDLNTNSISKKSLKPFSDTFLSQFLPPRKVRKGGELQSFYFNHFLINQTGEATFVAEQYYKSVSSYTDISSGMINYTTTYFYNDIIVVHVNEAGEIEWNIKIPKKQYSSNDNGHYLSYALAYKNDKISIIFNDHPRNLQVKDRDYQLRYMNNVYRAQPIHVMIDNTGMITYKKLNLKKGSLVLRPKKAITTHEKQQLLLLSERSKNLSISRIKL